MTPSSEVSTAQPSSISIPLPAVSPPQAPAAVQLRSILILFVSVLAFLLASFPARNSDLLLHLARGRLLAHGEFPSTSQPDLAFEEWGNQTWLYDLFCYGCYRALGGAGLVIAKALLASGIALLLLRLSRSSSGWCVAALCTSLALLTMSRYLLLQPTTVSYFFLALALTLLCSPKTSESEARPPLFSWPLLLLFVVWANVDRWFLLGLGVAALVWLGEVVDAALAVGTSPRRWPAILLRRGALLVVLAAACLLNPSHLNAFVLADELPGLSSSASQIISPFESIYLASIGWEPSSLAYFFLLGLSLLSFAAALPHWRWRRFLPWLGLAMLSATQTRAIPFFAVAACPVMAWNIQDIRAGRFKWARQWAESTQLVRLGQTLTVVLVAVLVICSWPGWLQSPPYGSRRWALDLSPSLERAAATVHRWRQEGKLQADSGGLHLSNETVYAFAWYAPAEKRLRLTSQDAGDVMQRQVRSAHVDHVLVHDANRARLSQILLGFAIVAEQWPLLHMEGDVAIFGWRDPDRAGSADLFRGWELDLNRLAFHPDQERKAPSGASPTPRNWWEAFWKAAPLRSIDRDEALMYLLYAEALQQRAVLKGLHLTRWQNSAAAGLVGAAAAWMSPTALCDAHFRLLLLGPQLTETDPQIQQIAPLDRMILALQARYIQQRDDVPPALYYLAARAARRAIAANPDDAPAHLLLGESYIGFLNYTRERGWGLHMPTFLNLRRVQAATALNRALVLRPDFIRAHAHLGRLYEEMGWFDLALKHWRAYGRLARQVGPQPGASREDFQNRLAQNEEKVEQLARKVQKLGSTVTLGSEDRPSRESARMSFEKGLAGKALDLLLESDYSAFGDEGMELELELLLGVGRAADVQEWLIAPYENTLGTLSYHWFHARALAALGDYSRAEDECEEAARGLVTAPDRPGAIRLHEIMAGKIGSYLLNGQRTKEATFANLLRHIEQDILSKEIKDMAQRMRRRAELSVLRGLLALEEGEVEEAEEAFRAALAIWKDQSMAATGGGMDFQARPVAQECLRWLE